MDFFLVNSILLTLAPAPDTFTGAVIFIFPWKR